MKRCPVCGKESPDERTFCPFDGTRLSERVTAEREPLPAQGSMTKRCPVCQTEFPDQLRFCVKDGTPLVEAVSPVAAPPVVAPPVVAPPIAAPPAAPVSSSAVFIPKLTVLSPEGELLEFTLQESFINIGRNPENNIELADPTVSRVHATIRRQDGEYVITDAGSRTGIIVNGQRVGPQGHALRQGDVVTIGHTRLTFAVEPVAQPQVASDSGGAAAEQSRARQLGRIDVMLPTGEMMQVPVASYEVNIGADNANEVVLRDQSVSPRHAVIRLYKGKWYALEADGSPGIFVNGQRVGRAGEIIQPGDIIQVGQSRLSITPDPAARFQIGDERRSPAVPGSRPGEPAYAGPMASQPPREPSRPLEAAPQSPVQQSSPQVGTLDGRYDLEEKIGEDSTGTLYRARRVLLGDKVAIRMLRPEMVKDPVAYERFRRQAQVAARIRHPNSVQIYDFGTSADGTAYIVEELLSGRTLRDLVYREFGLTLPRVVGILNQVCGAVHTAHLNGIVLRDIKPESIFVEQGPDGKELIKVGGYGLAKVDSSVSSGMTMAAVAKGLGTPQYMSPEQWMDQPLDSRSDVYSLGIILFELLTGSVPFNSVSPTEIAQMHLTAPVPDITDFGRRDLDEGLAAVINRALSKDPRYRQATALQLAAEIQAVSGAGAPGGLFGAIMNKATGLRAAPVFVPGAPPAAAAGEAYLPSVVAESESKGRGAFNPVVLALMAEAFLSRLSSGMIKTAVPLYALLVFGLDIASVMVLVLIQNIVPLLLRPLFGSMADKYGKKKIFLISLSIRTLVSVLYVIATLPLLFIISAVRGIADSAKGPSASAMIADNTDERNIAKAYSWYTTTKSTSGGIGEAVAVFLLVSAIVFFAGKQVVPVNVAVLDEPGKTGPPATVILKGPEEVPADRMLPATDVDKQPRKVALVEQRQMQIKDIPIDDLPKVVDGAALKKALVVIFIVSTILSALSLLLVWVFIKEKKKVKKAKEEKRAAPMDPARAPAAQPNVWAFALLGAALTAPAYMVTGEFFTILAVKLEVTPYALGWIKIVAETAIPLIFGPVFGWLADRIGTGKVIALRSIANLVTSVLFWITPWFVGTVLLGFFIGLARAVDEIGKAAFKPTWGAIAAKVSSFNLARRSRTMGIMEGGIDASDLAFPVLAGVLLQYLSLGFLMAVRAVLAILAEVYAFFVMRKYKI